jgi:hypothetical protein
MKKIIRIDLKKYIYRIRNNFYYKWPNLNLLGEREPDIYGNTTLEDLENDLKQIVIENDLNIHLVFMQSNSEGEIVDQVQKAGQRSFRPNNKCRRSFPQLGFYS